MSDVDPKLQALFVAERARTLAPAEAKARVLARVTQSIAAPSITPPSRLLSLLAAAAIGAAGGAIVAAKLLPPKVVYVDRVVTFPAPVVPAPSSEEPPSIPSFVVPSAAPSSPNARHDDLAHERQLLDIARTALGRGDGAHALEAVERHAHEFPRGQMSEEREAIAVQALAKLGRKDEARTRGDRFRKRYPNSVLAPVIDAALAAE